MNIPGKISCNIYYDFTSFLHRSPIKYSSQLKLAPNQLGLRSSHGFKYQSLTFLFFFGFSYDANGPIDGMSFGQTLHLHAPLQCFVLYSLMLYLNAHALESRHTHTPTQKKKKNPNLFQTYKKFTVMAGLLSLMCIVEMSVLVSWSVSYLPK